MASGALDREGRFIEARQSLPGVLLGSQVFLALRWMMLEKVLGVGVERRWLYLASKPPHY
jgi:hypothetical protein